LLCSLSFSTPSFFVGFFCLNVLIGPSFLHPHTDPILSGLLPHQTVFSAGPLLHLFKPLVDLPTSLSVLFFLFFSDMSAYFFHVYLWSCVVAFGHLPNAPVPPPLSPPAICLRYTYLSVLPPSFWVLTVKPFRAPVGQLSPPPTSDPKIYFVSHIRCSPLCRV